MKSIYNIKTGLEVDGKLDADGKQRHPKGHTFLKPPETGENEIAIFDGDEHTGHGKWTIKPDYRGKIYYDTETRQRIEITQIGELPDNITDQEPGHFDKWEGKKWVKDKDLIMSTIRAYRTARLQETDWTQMPDVPLIDKEKLNWITYRQKLRDLPETIEADKINTTEDIIKTLDGVKK